MGTIPTRGATMEINVYEEDGRMRERVLEDIRFLIEDFFVIEETKEYWEDNTNKFTIRIEVE